MTPQAWSAIAGCTTAVVAVIALLATVPQYRQAKRGAAEQIEEQRRLVREQARPYVAVSMEFGLAAPAHLVQFVVSNLGHTSAKEVRITSNPRLQRATPLAIGGGEEVFVPETFPTLVPGQRWATFWDMGYERHGSGLADRHEVTVTYTDGRGASYTDTFVLDWATIWNQRQMPPKSLHDAATALLDIAKTMGTWSERSGGGLQVWQRDGHRKDEEEEEQLDRLQQRLRDQAEERRQAGEHRPDLDHMTEQIDKAQDGSRD